MPKSLEGLKAAKPESKLGPVPKHDVYAPASKGPFKCSHCEYFALPSECSNDYIIKLRGPEVEPEACCDLYEPKDEDK